MSLETGTRLGAFEILAPLGAGGMGEVYKAKDTRLGRLVAIKVLPSHLAENAELKKRFEQEAHAISSLNHPNICTLYDVGHENGTDFIVMELLDGESLSDRLKKGALPLDDALRIGTQIAEALDQAHREGIVHRDLKPGNVMLTPSGAKLLDFGLAKLAAFGTGDAASSLSNLPTEAKSLTAQGAILGTFRYMAPEQLEGQTVDARTDVFALGALLYEMVTGRKAFEGKSQASLIGAIMTSQPPPVSQVQATAPPALDHVIRTCLAKDPEERWQSARDVLRGLRWVSESASSLDVRPQAAPESARLEPWKVALGLGLTALVTALATWTFVRPDEPEPPPVRRFSIDIPANMGVDPASPGLALSPDGTQLAFVLRSGSTGRVLYLRSLDELEARPLPGTEGARNPFFSPDGEWIAFFTDSEAGAGADPWTLKRISVLGGPPLTLATASNPHGSWSEDDTIVFVHDGDGGLGLFRIPVVGGPAERLTAPDTERGEFRHQWPHVLPGGESIVFTAQMDDGSWRLALLSLETGEWETLVEQGYNARYAHSGHLVYALSGVLMAAPFDLDRLEITGSTVPIFEDVAGNLETGNVGYNFAPDGSFVYLSGSAVQTRRNTLVWVDREGREEALSVEPRSYVYPRVSPDGKRVALDARDEENDIWIWDLSRETLTRLTFDSRPDQYMVWTPDGERVVFASERSGQANLYWRSADGSGTAEPLSDSVVGFPTSMSPDGRDIAFRTQNNQLGVLSLDDERSSRLLLSGEFAERNGEIAPDGRWLAYESNESGQYEIYVRPFPDVEGGRWQISTNGGTRPLWSPDGRELFYLDPDRRLMVAPVETGDGFAPGTPERLLDKPYYVGPAGRPYDITPDGQTFLMLQSAEPSGENTGRMSFTLILNWFRELRGRVRPR